MLVPGVLGQSENIEVISVIGRYLEHSRIYYFRNNGNEEIFLSSADLMSRNLEKRIELMFPLLDPKHALRVKETLELYFKDTLQAHSLNSDGSYLRVEAEGKLNSQEELHQEAKQLAKNLTSEKGELRVRRRKP